MNTILRVALAAARMGALQQGVQSLRRLALSLVASGVALFCLLAALLWLDAALWFYCLTWAGPTIAALIAAGALIVVAGAILIGIQLARPRRAKSAARPPTQFAVAGAEKAGQEVNRLVRENPKSALALAILAGLALSASPRARR